MNGLKSILSSTEYLKSTLDNYLDSCKVPITVNKQTAYNKINMSDFVIAGKPDCKFKILISSGIGQTSFNNLPVVKTENLANNSASIEYLVVPATIAANCPVQGWKLVGIYTINPVGTYLVQGEIFSNENADLLVAFETDADITNSPTIINMPTLFVWSKGVVAGAIQTVPFSFMIKDLSMIKVFVACKQNSYFYAHAFISGYLIKKS